MIEAVFFDMDNTLVDTEWAAAKAVRLVVESFDRVFDSEDEEAVIGLPWRTIFDNTIEKYKLEITRPQLKDLVINKKAEILANSTRHELPGAVNALRLCKKHYPVAIVSGSYRKEIQDTIDSLNIADDIQFFVANEDVVPGKPAPGPYLEAARRLGVNPENCLVFEDSVVGIDSAKSAGMTCVAVEFANEAHFDLGKADIIIKSLETVTEQWLSDLEKTLEK